jgi:hypothetical protein
MDGEGMKTFPVLFLRGMNHENRQAAKETPQGNGKHIVQDLHK